MEFPLPLKEERKQRGKNEKKERKNEEKEELYWCK